MNTYIISTNGLNAGQVKGDYIFMNETMIEIKSGSETVALVPNTYLVVKLTL